MNHITALDPNMFLWETNDVEMYPEKYKIILFELMDIIDVLESNNNKIILKKYFQDELENHYPAIDENSDVTRSIYRFLAKVQDRIIEYPEFSYPNIYSDPLVINYLLSEDFQNEIKILLSALYNYSKNEDDDEELTFVTVGNLRDPGNNFLKLIVADDEKEIISIQNSELLSDFLIRSKRKYEMNPKHDPEYGWGSPFSANKSIAKRMLFNSIISSRGNSQALYFYDNDKEVFIVFRPHTDNVYHAYENDNPNEIPSDIRQYFLKEHPSKKTRKQNGEK
ncbi:hypothetical protein SAMN02799630_04671 [Paenibacillus sp. UNCCL117]|uniref:hypothetical protein n=1 Tax=unclassified Paenibacillus TaxID=185978 RepID=UPI000880F1AD|nr:MULTISPECIES: hypothetical protein [unclassified Paenibacillus]SDE06791.1 hypothetical protein SAMN04488602_11824 [Paenibacillus sp. cl123]SFW59314.1 hypothetical protein SAMN02799630_04671 [Paenibacillus sp. UNCCL117]